MLAWFYHLPETSINNAMNKKLLAGAGVALFAGITIFALKSCRTIPAGAKAVKPFNKEKYLGKWYEIARMDFKWERGLNNVTAHYSPNPDGTIKVVNRGYDYTKKTWKESIGKAKPVSDPNEAKLKVSFFGPFYSGYNVIAIDPGYRYALVMGKNRNYLWLLSRETTMPEDVRNRYLRIAQNVGYNTDQLVWVAHNGR